MKLNVCFCPNKSQLVIYNQRPTSQGLKCSNQVNSLASRKWIRKILSSQYRGKIVSNPNSDLTRLCIMLKPTFQSIGFEKRVGRCGCILTYSYIKLLQHALTYGHSFRKCVIASNSVKRDSSSITGRFKYPGTPSSFICKCRNENVFNKTIHVPSSGPFAETTFCRPILQEFLWRSY